MSAKIGLDDFFALGGTKEKLFEMARDIKSEQEASREQRRKAREEKEQSLGLTGKPIIETHDRQQEDLMREFATAIGDHNKKRPVLFHGVGGLAHVIPDKKGNLIIDSVNSEVISDVAGKSACWIHTKNEAAIPTSVPPPKALCSIFLHTPDNWVNVPPIERIATAPFFASDGSLRAKPGYDPLTQVWISIPSDFQLPDTTPTPENLARAVSLIRDTVLGEVAFANEASRSHAVALMLQPFVRRLIPDKGTPLYIFEAPTQSSGKSFAAKLCCRPFADVASTTEEVKEEEWKKVLFAMMLKGKSHIFIDNVEGQLRSATLSSAITEELFEGRMLGVSQMKETEAHNVTWVATANNARICKDMVSRSVLVRIDTKLSAPEKREFAGDPEEFVRQNREEVIGAIVTIVRHWLELGKPLYTERKMRFGKWSQVMGGILSAAGFTDFLANMEDVKKNLSAEDDTTERFLAAWYRKFGTQEVFAKDLSNLALECEAIDPSKDGTGDVRRTGKLLGKLIDRNVMGAIVHRKETKIVHRNGAIWFLELTPEWVEPEWDNDIEGDDSESDHEETAREGLFDGDSEVDL